MMLLEILLDLNCSLCIVNIVFSFTELAEIWSMCVISVISHRKTHVSFQFMYVQIYLFAEG